jgi:hypothetical protein
MKRPRRGGMAGAVIALLALLVESCSGSRYIEAPAAPGPELGLTAQSEDLGMAITHIVGPNGPGAWVKDASWTEYTFTLRNLTDKTVTIERIRLVDPRGLYIDPSVNPLQLEKTSEALAAQYKDAVALATPAIVGTAALIGAGTVIGVVAPPVVLVALPVYGIYKLNKVHATAQEREQLERELNRRQLPSLTLAGNSTVSGSLFFPIVPTPRALAVNYRVGSDIKEFALAMPPSAPQTTPAPQGPAVQSP